MISTSFAASAIILVGLLGLPAGAPGMGSLCPDPGADRAGAPPQAQVQDLQAKVRDRETAFARTMAERDLEAFSSFVSEEAVFFAGSNPIRGKAAVLEAWEGYFEGPEAPFSWGPEVVEVLDSGTLALTSGPVRDREGAVVGIFNTVWRLEDDGTWRVVFDKGCPTARR